MRIKKTFCSSLAALLVMSVSGCGLFFGDDGVFRDRRDDYLKAQSVEPIKIPSDSKGERLGQLFVIPPLAGTGSTAPAEFVVPKPSAPEKIVEQTDEIKIQKLGERRWIDIRRTPAAVWPQVRDFLSNQSMPIVEQSSVGGTLETAWIPAQTTGVDRYRIQLESGLSPQSTEIRVVQMNAARADDSAAWPERSMDADREAWLIKELATYLASHTDTQASMLAQGANHQAQRVLLLQSPEPILQMTVDYARAWASVSGALNSDGYRVDSANREQGDWLVSVVSSEDKDETTQYRAHLQRLTDDKVQVTVRSSDGETLPEAEAEKLLQHIWDNLL